MARQLMLQNDSEGRCCKDLSVALRFVLLVRTAPNTKLQLCIYFSVCFVIWKMKYLETAEKQWWRIFFVFPQGPPTDAPAVDTAEQVYISSLALLKVSVLCVLQLCIVLEMFMNLSLLGAGQTDF